MSNSEISILLRNIATAYTIKNESKFRFQILAYQKASEAIIGLNGELKDYYKENKLNTIPGVGKTIQSHLEELFEKGKVSHFDWVLDGVPESVFVLTQIPTFGPKKAYKIISEFKLENPKTIIDDLEKLAKTGKIANLAGFGEKSQADILRAIDDFRLGKGKTTRMVLPYAFEIAQKITDYMRQEKEIDKIEALGSFRRRVSTVGDIDFAVATKDPKKVIEHFVNYPYRERVIEKGEVSASILISGGKQIDLLIQPADAFGSLLQHFTGSKDHNVRLREYALKKGISLSEKGFKKKSKDGEIFQKFEKEEAFYKALEMDWIPPELRENKGEIEAAINRKLPKLIELKDVKGEFHTHSSFPIEPSHDLGRSSIAEMAEKAVSFGYEYIGFSEHNPSISKHTNEQIYTLIKNRNNEIDKVQKSNKDIRIFKLLEVDILPNGNLAIDNDCLSLLDAAIVSVHSVFKMDRDQMTQRVLKALSNKKAKILAHPTGRLLNDRNGYELDWEKLFEFSLKNNKAVEINSYPTRLDLPDTLVRKASVMGVKMVINSDAHSKNQMEHEKYGVFVARRGWAQKRDILNTLSYNEMANWFRN